MNAKAIIILCSQLCVGDYKPLTDSEWSKLMSLLIEQKVNPSDLLDMSQEELENLVNPDLAERIRGLRGRSVSLAFELNKYQDMGIRVITVADSVYPKKIRKKLKTSAPPLFYYAGNLELCNYQSIGFVGSRNIDEEDMKACHKIVETGIRNNYGVVSGGAKGIDSISVAHALACNGYAVIYAADSLAKYVKKKENREALLNNKMVILSTTIPTAGFNVGMAMGRNKYIYCQSKATVIVASDFEKGGTWTGACECIKKELAPVYCLENPVKKGNMALIALGARAITSEWNMEIEELVTKEPVVEMKQLSLFD